MQHLADDPPQKDLKQDESEEGVEGTESTIVNQEINTQQKFSDTGRRY